MVTPPYRDVTVGALLTRLAEALPDNDALVYGDGGPRWTFAQLEVEAREIARGLLALGVKPGERVAVWATNVPEWVVLQFALAKIGAILVTVNTALRGQEIDYLLRQSGTGTLVTIRGFRDVDYIQVLRDIGALGGGAYRPRTHHLYGADPPPGTVPHATSCIPTRSAPLKISSPRRATSRSIPSSTCNTPRHNRISEGRRLSSRNIVNNGYWLGVGLGFTPRDRLCLCVPLFHCFGCVIGVLGAFTHGACLCAVEFFEPRKVLETVARERCTALYGVPTMFLAQLEHPDFATFDLSSLRTGIMAGSLCRKR